jgi:hypothetical protein
VGDTRLEVWLTILRELVYYWWTSLQADRHEMGDWHATVQVTALVNNKTGVEWKEGKVEEGDWPSHTLENAEHALRGHSKLPNFSAAKCQATWS